MRTRVCDDGLGDGIYLDVKEVVGTKRKIKKFMMELVKK
jgi:hypothetical protein